MAILRDKKITIYDLAKLLDVSAGTVSRSLNDHPSISQKTKDRVMLLAREKGYKVNKFAANLRNQKTHTIGIIVPRLNSNFMSTILAGIEKTVNDQGYNLIISQSLETMEKEKLNAKTLFDSNVDALLVSLAYDTENFDHFTPYLQHKIPVIFLDRIHNLADCSTIIIDNQLAGFEATEHLIEQGCTHIIYIGGNLKRNVYSERYLGFKRALEKYGLAHGCDDMIETDLNPEHCIDVIRHIKSLKRLIDGLFVANDAFAAACMKSLKKAGYSIPDDIKVIGFNNDPISKLVTPTLSTINYPGYDMGVLAGQSVINQLNGTIDLKPANAIVLRHKLIVRESSIKTKK